MAEKDKQPIEKRIEQIDDELVRTILRSGIGKQEQFYDTYTPRAVEILTDKFRELEEKVKEFE